jgi:protein SCO1
MPARQPAPSLYLLSLAAIAVASPARGDAPPPPLTGVGITERLDSKIDLALPFRDHEGNTVTLGQYFDGQTPVLLTLNYFRCRTLCDLQLVRLAARLRQLDATSTPFVALAISIDPRDTVAAARAKRATHARAPDAALSWSFLVDDGTSAATLAAGLGASFRYDRRSDQYAHAPALFVAAPDGRVVRYLYGVDYPARDVRFALIEAAAGRSGSSADKLLLSCFRYDATTGRYGPYVIGLVRVGGVFTVVALAVSITLLQRRTRRQRT